MTWIDSLKNNSSAMLKALLILAIVATVLGGISQGLTLINTATLPVELQPVVSFAQTVFNVPVVTFAVVFLVNVYGFYKNKIKANLAGEPELQYSIKKELVTIGKYVPIATILFMAVPAPWSMIIFGAIAVFDMVKTELFGLCDNSVTETATETT